MLALARQEKHPYSWIIGAVNLYDVPMKKVDNIHKYDKNIDCAHDSPGMLKVRVADVSLHMRGGWKGKSCWREESRAWTSCGGYIPLG